MTTKREMLIKGCDSLLEMTPPETALGVCWHLDQDAPSCMAYEVVDRLSVGFRGQVSRTCFPLRGYEDYTIGRWEGKNRELRIELIQYIKEQLLTYTPFAECDLDREIESCLID